MKNFIQIHFVIVDSPWFYFEPLNAQKVNENMKKRSKMKIQKHHTYTSRSKQHHPVPFVSCSARLDPFPSSFYTNPPSNQSGTQVLTLPSQSRPEKSPVHTSCVPPSCQVPS